MDDDGFSGQLQAEQDDLTLARQLQIEADRAHAAALVREETILVRSAPPAHGTQRPQHAVLQPANFPTAAPRITCTDA